MTNWEKKELKPLFDLLLVNANEVWKPENVLLNTKKLGTLIVGQLKEYKEGKYRRDRNEAIGFFEAIDKFAATGLPLSLDHFTDLVNQYKERVTPYPHYSGLKVVIPSDLSSLETIDIGDVPSIDNLDDQEEDGKEGASLTLM